MPSEDYNRCFDVETFESRDQQRILLFNHHNGELVVLVDQSADLWQKLDGRISQEISPEDKLLLESLYRRGFVDRGKSK